MVGRPRLFNDRVNRATGLSADQDAFLAALAVKAGVSKMALLRCAVTLLMRRQKHPVSPGLQAELKDVLSRLVE